jgi:hypothetical protein
MTSLEAPCSCCFPYEPTGKVSRVEPKTFFANERTFLSWLNMSVTLGSIASALAAFGKSDRKQAAALQIMATVLVVTAISFCLYASKIIASYTYVWSQNGNLCIALLPISMLYLMVPNQFNPSNSTRSSRN